MQPFGHNMRGPKIGGCAPFWGRGSWVPIWHNVAWAEAYLHAKRHIDPCNRFATMDMGQKLGALPPFWEGEDGSPSNTMSFGRLDPSWHLNPSSRLGTTDMDRKLGA